MSYGFLANPPVTKLSIFSEASFDYSTSSTSTIDTELLQAQTDDVYTDASAQSIVLANIGALVRVSNISGSGTTGTNLTYNSANVLEVGSYYAISFYFNLTQTATTNNLRALTAQDNFGNIYDAGKGASTVSVRNCCLGSNKLYVGDGNIFTLTIYTDGVTNGGAYTYALRINIIKIK
jgi:hypothetical protein